MNFEVDKKMWYDTCEFRQNERIEISVGEIALKSDINRI